MPSKTCLGCSHLSRCARVTAQMVLDGDRCALYEAAQQGEEEARARILTELGPYAVLPKPNPRIEPHDKELHMPTNTGAKKPTLRQLGVEAKIFKDGDMRVFQMDQKELLEALEKTFPGISGMEESEVQDLLSDVKKNGVTGGGKSAGKDKDDDAPRGRGRGSRDEDDDKKKDEEPPARGRGRAAREEEPAKEEPPARGRGRGRSSDEEPAKKDEEPPARGRGRGRAAAEEPKDDDGPPRGRGRGRGSRDEEPKADETDNRGKGAEKSGPDNTQVVELLENVLGKLGGIEERLDKLEAQGTDSAKALGKLQDKVAVLRDGVECVVFGDQAEKGEKTLEDVIKRVQG